MNKYKNCTDSELFKLWKEVNKDIAQIGEELVERKYKLSKEEFEAIDYYLQKSKMYNSGFWLCQEDWGEDYFHDDDIEENLILKEGLKIIYESFTDDIYKYPTEIVNGLKMAINRFLGEEI